MWSADDSCSGDGLRMTQIMNNLVSNACKFTDTGYVILSAKLLESVRDGKATIQVSCQDTGIGLTPEQMEKVFDALYQVRFSECRFNVLCLRDVVLGVRMVWV
ncbi:hypothetical protein SARC_00960 [Sphaeroforma arctica JP610]|uniref:Histidine kinase/HSP90-like ATPase domain-containing protein n=1 Tax=Sphaeroforma arctica JP610 TaxID=667725 RepID=A0A0L0GD23_9EUKA|nr:hypothetical protein SARC_00960 [Sphaeroforma arctica JP610]KNC86915.1 hypothetical protein SARC_00960 [Sphaeroforma arctica JP610]|eukprot:XP_014160817.1 hypothetical protein SARC_00960 [Sphaeroforma arctica JP610]